MNLRPETAADISAISVLTTAAFLTAEHSDGTEAAIVDNLRAADALLLSLVAVEGESIVGHIAFSPVTIAGEDRGWVGLGPVSVAPDRQGKGVGSALIREGLARMHDDGRKGCVVLGDPAYYVRFGFAANTSLWLQDVPPEYFMALSFGGPAPQGEVAYHPAFTG
ncbi:N-acetyltransferase [Paracoccus aurantiacus]|uniref:N-acetyltransferase n=1 Tax=Paracoccus aurantiacus TaxID=2599412 RepID=A0A5C6S6U3_9RHOB|nr:N-acetyltransferase [Paracoccus aurantiacus]TXB69771.1 N-acetyltransferase [Paracoccus aurantiacus]